MQNTLKLIEYCDCKDIEQSIRIIRANRALLNEEEALQILCSVSHEMQYKLYEFDDIKNLIYNEDALTFAIDGQDLRGEFYFRENIANIYSRLGLYDLSIEVLNIFLSRVEDLGNLDYQANLLARIGSSYWSIGDLKNAKKYLHAANDLSLKLNNLIVRGNIIQSLFAIYTGEGKHLEALELLKQIEKINSVLKPPAYHLASTQESFGLAYKELGDFQRSDFYFKKGLEILKQDENWDRNSMIMSSGLNGNLAVNYTYLGDFKNAYEHVLLNLISADRIQDEQGIVAAYGQMGVIYKKSKDFQKAAEVKLNMLTKAEELNHPGWAGIACDNLALIYKSLNQEKEAFEYYKRSIAYKLPSGAFGLESYWTFCYLFDQYHSSRFSLMASFYLVEDLRNFMRLSLPVAMVRRWTSPIEYLIEKSIFDKGNTIDQQKLTFQNAVNARIADSDDNGKAVLNMLAEELDFAHNEFENLDSKEIGFHLLESIKAQAYLEQLALSNVNLDDYNNSPELVARKKEITQRIIELQNQIQKSKTNGILEKSQLLKKELNEILAERTIVDKQIDQANPTISALKNDRPPTINEVQELLEDDEIFLEYLLTDSKGKRFAINGEYWYAVNEYSSGSAFVFYIDKENFGAIEIGRTEQIAELTNFLLSLIEDQAYEDFRDNADEFQTVAHQLYTILLKQALSADQQQKKKLIIAPDGVLNSIPFDVLITKDNGEVTDFSSLSYVNEFYEVSYVQSARLLIEARKREHYHTKRSQDLITVIANDNFQKLGNLPSALREVATIEGYFKNTNTLDVNLMSNQKDTPLTKGKVLNSSALSVSKIIHFSCHAVTDSENYPNGALILNDNDITDEGVITAHEIMDMRTSADLVVLSACQTAVGSFERGEGIDSLVRAWNCTGALSIVATLWPAGDASSSNFMSSFYSNLINGTTISEAVRAAKITVSLIPEFSYPYHWACFSAYGNCRVMIE